MSQESDYSLDDCADTTTEKSEISIPAEHPWNDDTIDTLPGRLIVERHWYNDPLRRHDTKMLIVIVVATILILLLIPVLGIFVYHIAKYFS